MRACTDVARTFTGHPSPTRRGTSKVRWTYDSDIDIITTGAICACPLATSRFLRHARELLAARSTGKTSMGRHLIDGLEDGVLRCIKRCMHSPTGRPANLIGGAPHHPGHRSASLWAPQPRRTIRAAFATKLQPNGNSSRPRVSFADRFR
jgi:hypothetical protein